MGSSLQPSRRVPLAEPASVSKWAGWRVEDGQTNTVLFHLSVWPWSKVSSQRIADGLTTNRRILLLVFSFDTICLAVEQRTAADGLTTDRRILFFFLFDWICLADERLLTPSYDIPQTESISRKKPEKGAKGASGILSPQKIATSLHCYIATLLHRYIATLLHTSLHCYIATRLLHTSKSVQIHHP